MIKEIEILEKFNKKRCWKEIEKQARKKVIRKRIFVFSSIAASLIIVLTVFNVLYFSRGENFKSVSKKPVIITSTGKKIYLEDKYNNVLQVKGNKLSYNNNLIHQEQGLKLEYNTLILPKESECKILLDDGTIVWLNAESKIKYPLKFIGSKREVFIEGEAYFDVAHNKNKPFYVNCNSCKVKVLGTQFNISDYSTDNKAYITLKQGSVCVKKSKKDIILKPNQQVYIKNNIMKVKEVVADDFVNWMGQNFKFNNLELDYVMNKLSKWYGKKIVYKDETIKNIHITCRVKKYDSIDEIMLLIKKVTKINYKVLDKQIILYR